MRSILILFAALLLQNIVFSQTNPIITSWIQNTTATNPSYPSLVCNVQSVYYDATYSYITATDIPGYAIGPWMANPNTAGNQNYKAKLPLAPAQNTGTKTYTGLGAVGLFTNGVAIFNAKDGKYWNNATSAMTNGISQTGWNRNAYYWEGISFDACDGHPNATSAYHLHVAPICLYNQSATTVHAPIVGFAWDGFPIYGAYAYTNTNGTGAIKRMVSSYVLNTAATSRTLGPPVNGTYPLGSMCEDYVYTNGAGDLDQYNGRFCITPDYPSGTYCYFTTIDASGTPAYPFVLASQYYGVTVSAPYTNITIPTMGVTQYVSAPLPVELFDFSVRLINKKALLVWRVGTEQNVAQYEIERSDDAIRFDFVGKKTAEGKLQYDFTDEKLVSGNYYYRLKTIDKDGSFSYSTIVSVFMEHGKSMLLHNNPANDLLTIQHNDALLDRTIRIFDMTGKLVFSTILEQGSTMISLDVQTLYAGQYVINIADETQSISSKLIISK
jgi:YHYH protein/Secretion system C-terminal sorting domain